MSNKFYQRLAAAFIHPVENYRLISEEEGDSACACGHKIRNTVNAA